MYVCFYIVLPTLYFFKVKRLLVSVLLCECFIDRFNMSEKKDKSYTRKFRKEWLSDERVKDWLLEVPGDPSIARCKYCQCNLNVRLSDLLDHGRTKKHLKASEPFSTSRQSKLQFIPVKHTYECAAAEAALSLFVINHCSIRSVDHLSDLTRRFFKGADHASLLRLHRTKCSGLIRNILFQHFKSELQSDIDSGHFSLLIDESTDISVIKLLAVCIVYYSKQQHTIVSTFLGIVELEQGNADCIVSAIKSLLSDYGLDIKQMRGVGTDNASVMVGINNGVYQKLKQEVSNLVLIPCVCHSVQLAVSSAAEMLPRNVEFLISETYSWFSKSSSRQTTYRVLFQAINDGADPLKIVQQSNTRWLSIEVAVNRILNQWLELETHFETSRFQNKCYTAELLYGMYCDVINKLYLVFLKPYLEECQKVNKSFQSSTADPSKLLKDLILLIVGITRRIVVPGYRGDLLTVEVRKYKSPNIYLGHEVEILLTALKKDNKISPDNEKVFRNRCEKFLFCLADELQRRLPRNVQVLQKVSLIAPEQCLRVVKESIIPLAKELGLTGNVITKIDFQWCKLTTVQWQNVTNTIEFWHEVASYKDASSQNPFQELSDFAMMILVLPWSNADVERAFSMLNNVKTSLRNRLKTNMVNSILTVRAGLKRVKKCCHDYTLPDDVLNQIGTMAAYRSVDQPSSSTAELETDDVDELLL